MIEVSNIAALDQVLQIYAAVDDDTAGQRTTTYPTITYPDVRAQELRATANEQFNNSQQLAEFRKAWKIRKHNRTIAADMKVTDADSNNWYVTGWHPFKGSRNILVIEVERRDNAT